MESPAEPGIIVRHFRQILFWPVQLLADNDAIPIDRPWDILQRATGNPWKEVDDEFTGDPHLFQERHYHEFVSFLPYVQRFLYGDELGRSSAGRYGESPMRVFRRFDVRRIRTWFGSESEPVVFDIAHVDLYFFYDLDIAILVVELFANDLSLALAQQTLFLLGRAYPSFWDKDGVAGNCARKVEWLSASGGVLAQSDYERKDAYLAYVCEHRAPRVASHWAFLLRPIASYDLKGVDGIRLRQLEYYRMPLMAYLSVDDPAGLSRSDFVRLAFAGPPGDSDALPYSASYLRDFEEKYCYDRDWVPGKRDQCTRMLCCGHAFVVIGSEDDGYYTDGETGVLGQFRHETFLLGLISHVHRAALLMLSDRLIVAVSRLDIADPRSVRTFRGSIRQSLETFLRFTHRYWFHEVSDQSRARELFRMWSNHLGSDRLFAEVREEIQDMNQYLEADTARRQANTVVRLTVVTTFGLIGTVATGFLGMNLIAAADQPLATRFFYFCLVLIPTIALTFYTVAKSGRLSEFLEALADDRATSKAKLHALARVWQARRGH